MTVSCPRYGQVWGTQEFRRALDELRELGVGSVAVHPYARVTTDGAITFTAADRTGYLAKALEHAAAAGLQVFWKPHLAYWGSFSWRGAIHFETEPAWRRFFEGYRAFIVDHAVFAARHDVPMLSVGLEYERTVHRPEWRTVIDSVRRVYPGILTYAANWDGVTRVPFWDLVDLVGVQGYFPVGRGLATTVEIQQGWALALEQLRAVSARHGERRILFTELGYPRSVAAAERPWEPGVDGSEAALALRARLVDVVMSQVLADPLVAGGFWWKWMPTSSRWDRDFSMKDAEAVAALRRHWA